MTSAFVGVWREGADGYYLWVGADWDHFVAKWRELGPQGFRLVDIETYVDNGTRLWAGVWREGTDGYYLWAGADWDHFVAKWRELGPQGFRLVDIETYVDNDTRLWAGVWREGTDGYYLWRGSDQENFLGKWNEVGKAGLRLLKLAPIDPLCDDWCSNRVVGRNNKGEPSSYVYGVTGDPAGPYRWPTDADRWARLSAITFDGQPFTLPFTDRGVVHWGTWMYGAGSWHYGIDYVGPGGQVFDVVAAAPGRVVFVGWDNWSGNTVIVSHDVGGVADAFRTIYMHLRNGPAHDVAASWSQTVPILGGDGLTNYKAYLAATGGAENPGLRNPDQAHWGTDAQAIDPALFNSVVAAGDHLGWSGSTGPGGCGCTGGPRTSPNTHLHIFFARRDPSDNLWYFIDPYGIYSYGNCYPPGVTDAGFGPCVRYSVSWKGGRPQYP